jgi:hypothetical protein
MDFITAPTRNIKSLSEFRDTCANPKTASPAHFPFYPSHFCESFAIFITPWRKATAWCRKERICHPQAVFLGLDAGLPEIYSDSANVFFPGFIKNGMSPTEGVILRRPPVLSGANLFGIFLMRFTRKNLDFFHQQDKNM